MVKTDFIFMLTPHDRLMLNENAFQYQRMECRVNPQPKRRPQWRDVQHRFTDGRECLSAYLALEAAEVIAGAKPANLFAVSSSPQGCGRNLYKLWRRFGTQLLAESRLAAVEMRRSADAVLLLVYRPQALATLLARPNVAALLRRSGYATPPTVSQLLATLQAKMREGEDFPHEIGIILGYPLKDVAGFMHLAAIPFSCNGPWKIYGNPQRSLELAAQFRQCRLLMADQLNRCSSARQCLCSDAAMCDFAVHSMTG